MVEQIGFNAGIVWNALSGTRFSFTELLDKTGLSRADLCKALGWLGREGKLALSDGVISVTEGGDQAATETYGTVAGHIWQLLFGDPSEALSKCLTLDSDLVHAGLGWLAREGKVDSVDIFIVESLYSVDTTSEKPEETAEPESEEFVPSIERPLVEISKELAPFVVTKRAVKSRKSVKRKAVKKKVKKPVKRRVVLRKKKKKR